MGHSTAVIAIKLTGGEVYRSVAEGTKWTDSYSFRSASRINRNAGLSPEHMDMVNQSAQLFKEATSLGGGKDVGSAILGFSTG